MCYYGKIHSKLPIFKSVKNYTRQFFFYTGTACGACDKYEVCISFRPAQIWLSDLYHHYLRHHHHHRYYHYCYNHDHHLQTCTDLVIIRAAVVILRAKTVTLAIKRGVVAVSFKRDKNEKCCGVEFTTSAEMVSCS